MLQSLETLGAQAIIALCALSTSWGTVRPQGSSPPWNPQNTNLFLVLENLPLSGSTSFTPYLEVLLSVFLHSMGFLLPAMTDLLV